MFVCARAFMFDRLFMHAKNQNERQRGSWRKRTRIQIFDFMQYQSTVVMSVLYVYTGTCYDYNSIIVMLVNHGRPLVELSSLCENNFRTNIDMSY